MSLAFRGTARPQDPVPHAPRGSGRGPETLRRVQRLSERARASPPHAAPAPPRARARARTHTPTLARAGRSLTQRAGCRLQSWLPQERRGLAPGALARAHVCPLFPPSSWVQERRSRGPTVPMGDSLQSGTWGSHGAQAPRTRLGAPGPGRSHLLAAAANESLAW